MLQGKGAAAIRWITDCQGSVVNVNPDVVATLASKHPPSVEADEQALLYGPLYKIDDVIFENIDSSAIHDAAKNTSGAAGPSGLDADGWKRMLCSKSFKSASVDLCDALARMARKLATRLLDPEPLSTYVACRLIPLDKNPGIRPIGIGEVLRRIVGKAITTTLKPEILSATAPLQACAGLKGGVEAAVHALREVFEDPNTQGILLVDAENAFNALNRSAALHNSRIICPEFSIYIINTYRKPAKLFISNTGGKFILSQEGTTQGDNCASGLYACSMMPLMESISIITEQTDPIQCSTLQQPIAGKLLTKLPIKHVWFADDSAGGGTIENLEKWWNNMKSRGPFFGYFPKPSKTWLIVKEGYLEAAKITFKDINITTEGHRYLGSYIGSKEGKNKFICEKAQEWIKEIESLSSIAAKEPQLAYSAFVYGSSRRWGYIMRTTPNISDAFQTVEDIIRTKFIPQVTGRSVDQVERDIFALPARYGGLGITNPTVAADMEYENSLQATRELVNVILEQRTFHSIDTEATIEAKKVITRNKNAYLKDKNEHIIQQLSPIKSKYMELACEKGASSWLTTMPLEEYGFALNKQEFYEENVAKEVDLPNQ